MRVLFYKFSSPACMVMAVFSVACGTSSNSLNHQKPQRKLHSWSDDGGAGKVTVRISLTDQIAEFKRGDREIGWCYVATGKEGHSTQAGTYSITEKIVDKHSNKYGWIEDEFGNVTDGDAKPGDRVPAGMMYVPAPMPYWMRLTSYGIGMHSGIIPQPGEPASHGCIRMPKDFVATLFENVTVGTPVMITNSPASQGPSKEMQLPHEQGTLASKPEGQAWKQGGNAPQNAQSVTYRNGLPVFYQ